jgi:hypothetical protein
VYLEALADGQKRLPLALLGTLPVADMDSRGVEVANGESGADRGIHASTEEDNGAGFGGRNHS